MHTTHHNPQASLQQLLQECPLPGTAPVEIHGARALGCRPEDPFMFQGFRYVLDVARDVLVREDIQSWLSTHRKTLN